MGKLNRNHLNDLWQMRNLTVGDFIDGISKNPNLRFLITAVGFWWMARLVLAITIGANVVYYLLRISRLVLG